MTDSAKPSARQKRDDRIHDVFKVLLDYEGAACIQVSMSHTLSCGNRVRISFVGVESFRDRIKVSVDFEFCKPYVRNVANMHDAATAIVDVMDSGKLCLECCTVYTGKHVCDVGSLAIILGRETTDCCICLSECVGATVFECKHKAHLYCAQRLEDGSCPMCRRPISDLEEF